MDVDRSAASRHLKTASQVLYPALRFPTRLPLGVARENRSRGAATFSGREDPESSFVTPQYRADIAADLVLMLEAAPDPRLGR
jgi:hypothetical protein